MDATGDYVVTYSASQQTVTTPDGLCATGNSYDVIAVIFRSVSVPLPAPPVVPPVAPPALPLVVPPVPTTDPALAIAFLSSQNNGKQEEQDRAQEFPLVPPLPESAVGVSTSSLAVPAVPPRSSAAATLIQQLGGTQSVGAISGRLFADLNGDGTFDPGKPPLAGRLVFLDLNGNGILDEGEPVATTNSNGEYSFTSLPLQTYQVRQLLSSGDVQTLPPENRAYEVRLDNTRHDVGGRNFGDLYSPRRTAPAPVPSVPPLPQSQGSSSAPFDDEDSYADE
jgi:hypothetical protein